MHKTILSDEQCRDKITPCFYQNCNQVFFQKIKLIKHIKEYHKGVFSTETYEFSSQSEFLAWKEKEEANNYVFFSKKKLEVNITAKKQKQVISFVKLMVIQSHIALEQNQQEKQIKDTSEVVLNLVLSALQG